MSSYLFGDVIGLIPGLLVEFVFVGGDFGDAFGLVGRFVGAVEA